MHGDDHHVDGYLTHNIATLQEGFTAIADSFCDDKVTSYSSLMRIRILMSVSTDAIRVKCMTTCIIHVHV